MELSTEEAALFTVRYLNNMQLTGKGLIVDFCLQDARKMFRRTQKLEKHQRLALERKEAAKKERRANSRAEKQGKPQFEKVVELGKRSKPDEKKKKETVAEINDVH